MTFKEAISVCFFDFFNFKGRASRSEFFWVSILLIIPIIIADLFDLIIPMVITIPFESAETISDIIFIITFIPLTAVGARRLHDINKSGWWQLLQLTVIGLIPLLYWWCWCESTNEDNRYGSIKGRA